uniref:FHA domain-containing protein n=1 Tax=Kalanchoe fedtschenkoi TaxID=63787 RepID=A0A7N0TFI2_KALFE
MARRDRSASPAKRRRESPHRRDRSPSPVRASSSLKSRSSEPDKARHRSPKPTSPHPRSPSPRTGRLKKTQAESGDRRRERERERDGGSGKSGRERDNENNSLKERRDAYEPYRRKREHSASPSSHHHRSGEKLDSGSHSADRRLKEYGEEKNAGEVEPNENGDDSVVRMKAVEEALVAKKKEQPSFELSGKLADETNRVKEPLYIHRQSCYLFGRERRVADIPTDHPSCSKQHAVIQYRQIEQEQPDGMLKKVTRPYLMDLGSTNGTFINDNRLEPQRYYELIEQDTIKFGNSSSLTL